MYYKKRVKLDVSSFAWSKDELELSRELKKMYKEIKKMFTIALLHLKLENIHYEDSEINSSSSSDINLNCVHNSDKVEPEKVLSNHKKASNGTNISEFSRNNNFGSKLSIKKRFQDVFAFYDASNVFMTKILEELFKKPLNSKKNLFIIFNKLLKMFLLFDIARFKYHDLFVQLSLEKKECSSLQDDFLYKRASIFAAINMPMAHLFMSFFCKESDEIYVPTELFKRCSLNLESRRCEHVYLLASLMCHYDDFPYCRVFFCGLFNRFFYSEFLTKQIELLEEFKQAYYVILTEIK
ncbi:hypothetical protein EDEG_01446 [Edhazardia aedis USNM 41457]|uniref:Uncharacterized protein n=1 Tax=Edhazardia aedis (strain USNM 41457) TaxID=1003232 RepID=J9DP16_EDHAE|nr:hypothetical protein EDEG_01446 [Edhazardia aedis USNM 41457]|eukprot:EJW04290.1 hypothetical protein EDEG_01446 [Edhazardia aedis USNM 41457]